MKNEKGYVEETDREPSPTCSQLWYLPHHPVEHKQKKKIRRVTNAASIYKGHSLNKALLTGPDLLCSLVGLLLSFRQFAIAVTGDIEDMFMQIAVRKEDQDALRFLWYKNNTETIYKYKRLIFGATCSPSCAIYVLRKCALDNHHLSPEASQSITNNFYMDDFLQSFETTDEAIEQTTCIKETLKKGGFNLTKFFSNDSSFPLIDDTEGDKALTQRVLGQTWDVKNDTFIFRKPNLDIKIERLQQRELLSTAASLFDPLGMITPFAIRIRSLLQAVIKQGKKWDEQVPAKFHSDLKKWINEFNSMPDITTKRCLVTGPTTSQQLHVFTDASNIATSAVIYMRSTTTEGNVIVNYVISKSRVAPIKHTSIPKLELEAATMGAELASFVVTEMTLNFSSVHFWTDSTATLGWINSDKRQKVFVANRVNKILEHSKAEEWKHIPGKLNPADHGTRGLKPSELEEKWLQGPKFLFQDPENWNFGQTNFLTTTNLVLPKCMNPVIEPSKFSIWKRLLRRTTTVYKATNILRKRDTLNSQNEAQIYLIKISQQNTFRKAIIRMQTGQQLERRDAVLQFNPFLDGNGVLRAKGRLRHAPIPWNQKHPIILDIKDHVTQLIVQDAHTNSCQHMGTEFVRAHLQQTFLIIGLRRFLRRLSRTCFICRRWRAQNITPMMSDFPHFRFADAEKQYPFINVGLDYFGSFYIEDNTRKLEKQYICIFTCLVTRAVHLEVCHSLDTDSCLLAIRRFVSRRGYPEIIISDNGTNFTASKKVMNLDNISIDNSYIAQQLSQNIVWKMNPPLAPHFGGIWERIIQTAKRTLLIILGSQQLKAETFQTIVTETEGILNSRPITYVSSDKNDEEARTPNHFILRRPHLALAPLTSKLKTFRKKDFNYTQTLLDHFWKRLQREYTSDLISRAKWREQSKQLKVGDLVWILNEFTPRGIWPLGRITKCHYGADEIPRSFDIHTATGTLTRPAVKLSRVIDEEEADITRSAATNPT